MKKKIYSILAVVITLCIMLSGCSFDSGNEPTTQNTTKISFEQSYTVDTVPEFDGEPYVVINNNIPDFTKSDYTTTSYESYGALDYLGRCTSCIACISVETMPTEEREPIGSVKPTGWKTVKYENVDGKYLYNRCHLIGYQLTAENANENNLITGTRYLNVEGMLPFENEVASYIRKTGNHILYRVTPIFKSTELVARGVQMEAYSIEDNGEGVCFNVYCYNNQPDIEIDYQTGESKALNEKDNFNDQNEKRTYIININSKKFHKKSCKYAKDIKDENKKTYTGTRESLIKNGYEPCKACEA